MEGLRRLVTSAVHLITPVRGTQRWRSSTARRRHVLKQPWRRPVATIASPTSSTTTTFKRLRAPCCCLVRRLNAQRRQPRCHLVVYVESLGEGAPANFLDLLAAQPAEPLEAENVATRQNAAKAFYTVSLQLCGELPRDTLWLCVREVSVPEQQLFYRCRLVRRLVAEVSEAAHGPDAVTSADAVEQALVKVSKTAEGSNVVAVLQDRLQEA